ncbi:MAG: hypothetical protein LBD25_05440 [Coriobacteriales bacterium]|nr:hypothetical protein [Coriobacteriales bacterium]
MRRVRTACGRVHERLLVRPCAGQAMVEYLVVGLAVVAVVAALSAFGSRVQEGLFVSHAADSASHAASVNLAGTLGDVLLF